MPVDLDLASGLKIPGTRGLDLGTSFIGLVGARPELSLDRGRGIAFTV